MHFSTDTIELKLVYKESSEHQQVIIDIADPKLDEEELVDTLAKIVINNGTVSFDDNIPEIEFLDLKVEPDDIFNLINLRNIILDCNAGGDIKRSFFHYCFYEVTGHDFYTYELTSDIISELQQQINTFDSIIGMRMAEVGELYTKYIIDAILRFFVNNEPGDAQDIANVKAITSKIVLHLVKWELLHKEQFTSPEDFNIFLELEKRFLHDDYDHIFNSLKSFEIHELDNLIEQLFASETINDFMIAVHNFTTKIDTLIDTAIASGLTVRMVKADITNLVGRLISISSFYKKLLVSPTHLEVIATNYYLSVSEIINAFLNTEEKLRRYIDFTNIITVNHNLNLEIPQVYSYIPLGGLDIRDERLVGAREIRYLYYTDEGLYNDAYVYRIIG